MTDENAHTLISYNEHCAVLPAINLAMKKQTIH